MSDDALFRFVATGGVVTYVLAMAVMLLNLRPGWMLFPVLIFAACVVVAIWRKRITGP